MGLLDIRSGARRWWLGAYGLWMAVLGCAYFVWGAGSAAVVALIGVSGAAAIVVGVGINRPPQRLPWLMLAGALVANAAARVAYVALGLPDPLSQSLGGLAPVYALHLVVFVLLVGAYAALTWPHVSARRWPALIDATIVVLGAGLLAWVVIVQPWTTIPSVPTEQVVVRIAYVLRDVLILAAAARLVTAVRWSASVGLLVLSTLGLLGYDTLFRMGLIRGQWLWGGPIEIGWLTFYAALGAAALVPSMATIGIPTSGRQDENGTLPLALVSLSTVIPFALLLGQSLPSRRDSPWEITIAAVMLALVLIRLTLATVHLRRSRAEAMVVRDASAELVAASDLPAVEAAVAAAVRRLLRPDTTVSVFLAAEREADREPGSKLIVSLPRTRQTAASADRLVVRAPSAVLGLLRRPVENIAPQVSLALARIRLTEEVIGHRSDQYFRALVQNTSDVILIVDDLMHIRYASPSAARMFDSSVLDGARFPELLAQPDRSAAEELFKEKCRGPGSSAVSAVLAGGHDHTTDAAVRADWSLAGPDVRRVEMSCVDLRREEAVRGFVITLRDVTERRRLEERLTEQAFHDPLTGLGNRSLFAERVDTAMRNALQPNSSAAVLVIDLDDFKVVNDGHGHVIGDAFLKEVGERLSTVVGSTGVAARVGGDEFAVLVQGVDAGRVAARVAEHIVNTLAAPIAVQGHLIQCGASVGFATTVDARTPHDLFRHADLALYEAKGGGKQQWRQYDPTMASAIMDRLEMRATLSEALRNGALRLEYQPIVALESGQTVGFEALMRWDHPTRGRLGPSEFIAVAEESDLIVSIGEWALRTAIGQAVRWAKEAPDAPPYVSVNVSVKQFRSRDIFDLVRRHLGEGGLPADRLMVEITESLLLHDDEEVMEGLRRLRKLGVRIAIDDFGTGYSALSYLQRVPLDVVKLDRLFTSAMGSSARQRELVAGIVQLASTLRLSIIAEGIETIDEYGLVRQVGCSYGQGYLFSRPLPAAEALRWIAPHRVATR